MREDPVKSPTRTVRSGYNRIAAHYTKDREVFENWSEIDAFTAHLAASAEVLDVGCGTGIPIGRHLVKNGFHVTGIDLSPNMIAAARQNLPDTNFLIADMTALPFPPGSFDGIISCYAVFHVPRTRHAEIFRSFYTILRPGGIMLVSLGATDWEGTEDYYGVNMFWSHYAPERTVRLIESAGFRIELARNVTTGGETHYWVLAVKELL